MEAFVDHYLVLGLPSGEEASLNLSEKEILKAYKLKALVSHPDKRPDDPNAHEKFQRLKSSYEVLKDENSRKVFDDVLRVQREKQQKKSQVDSKRRKMMSDLEEREGRSGFAPISHESRSYDEEERIARKLKEEVDVIRAMYAKKRCRFETPESGGVDGKRREDTSAQLDKERALKVSWERVGDGYTVGRLREVFEKFGGVEDVVFSRSTKKKKKRSALIVMATKDEAVAATRTFCGDLSNPLLIVPVQRDQTDFVTAKKSSEAEPQSNIVGVGYQAYENDVMERLRKAGMKQKR